MVPVYQTWEFLTSKKPSDHMNVESNPTRAFKIDLSSFESAETPSFHMLMQQNRLKKRMTLMQVAEALQVPYNQVCLYENGSEIPNATILAQLKTLLDW